MLFKFQLVKEIEQLMNDKSLNKLKILWEKLDDHKAVNVESQNEDQNSLVNGILRYKPNSKWIPPNFAKLPVCDYDSKTSKLFSMAYNEEKRINNSPNVNFFFFTSYNNLLKVLIGIHSNMNSTSSIFYIIKLFSLSIR